MAGVGLPNFLKDETKIANALRMIQDHFQLDGVVCYADKTVLADALGCHTDWSTSSPDLKPLSELPGGMEFSMERMLQGTRVETAVQVTRRLSLLLPETILMCLVPGPWRVAKQVTGMQISDLLNRPDLLDIAAKATLAFSKALGDAGMDILVVSEETLPPLNGHSLIMFNKDYSPIFNTAKFYEIAPLLMVDKLLPELVASLKQVVDGVIFSSELDSGIWQNEERISLSLPVWLLEKDKKEIKSFLTKKGVFQALKFSKLFLVTTIIEINGDIDNEIMIRGIKTIRDLLNNGG